MKKKLYLVIGLVLGMGVIGAVLLPTMLASAIERGLPLVGQKISKDISVGSVDISWSGRCEIRQLKVSDEQGPILEAGTAVADMGIMGLLSRNILVNEFTLTDASLDLRVQDGRLNVAPPAADTPPTDIPFLETPDDLDDWVKAAYNTLKDYYEAPSAPSSTITDERGTNWTFGLDRLHCGNLALKITQAGKNHVFKPNVVLEGCGSSQRPFSLTLDKLTDSGARFEMSAEKVALEKLPLKGRQAGPATLNGPGSITFFWKPNFSGLFSFDQVDVEGYKDFPPIKDLTLSGALREKEGVMHFTLDDNTLEALEEGLIDAAKDKIEDEIKDRVGDEVKDKVGDKIKDIFKK